MVHALSAYHEYYRGISSLCEISTSLVLRVIFNCVPVRDKPHHTKYLLGMEAFCRKATDALGKRLNKHPLASDKFNLDMGKFLLVGVDEFQ